MDIKEAEIRTEMACKMYSTAATLMSYLPEDAKSLATKAKTVMNSVMAGLSLNKPEE